MMIYSLKISRWNAKQYNWSVSPLGEYLKPKYVIQNVEPNWLGIWPGSGMIKAQFEFSRSESHKIHFK